MCYVVSGKGTLTVKMLKGDWKRPVNNDTAICNCTDTGMTGDSCEINECENGRNIDDLLEGPVSHDGFKRLN